MNINKPEIYPDKMGTFQEIIETVLTLERKASIYTGIFTIPTLSK